MVVGLNPTEEISQIIEKAATSLVDHTWSNSGVFPQLPIPIEFIVEKILGLNIRRDEPASFGHRNSVGTLRPETKTILLGKHPTIQAERFTIAHEAGHWCLHTREFTSQDISSDLNPLTDDKLWFPPQSRFIESNTQEREADRFASALLIPRALIGQELQRFNIVTLSTAKLLAKTFLVSQSVMLIRLKELRRDWDSSWPRVDWIELGEEEGRLHESRGNHYFLLPKILQSFREQDLTVQNPDPSSVLLRRPEPDRRPYWSRRDQIIIEFAGLPNAGKDATVLWLYDYLKEGLGRKYFQLIDEGFRAFPFPDASQYHKLIWSIQHTAQKLIECVEGRNKPKIVSLNRGFYDYLVLLRWWKDQHKISKREEKSWAKFILETWAEWVDIVFLLDVSPEESIRREQNGQRRIAEHVSQKYNGIAELSKPNIVNMKTLVGLQEAYYQIQEECSEYFRIIKIPSNDFYKVADSIMDILHPVLEKQKKYRGVQPLSQAHLPGLEVVK